MSRQNDDFNLADEFQISCYRVYLGGVFLLGGRLSLRRDKIVYRPYSLLPGVSGTAVVHTARTIRRGRAMIWPFARLLVFVGTDGRRVVVGDPWGVSRDWRQLQMALAAYGYELR